MTEATKTRAAIAALGTDLNPAVLDPICGLYDNEQRALAKDVPATAADIVYGPHERHRLDVYAPRGASGPAPVLIWVHGGGFVQGDKGDAVGDRWPNAHVGRLAAKAGMLGVVINYRLAPQNGWPAGAEDVAAVVDWLKANASDFGGDPDRIVVAGTSAGAAHVSGYIKLRPDHAKEVRGAIMLSGVYGVEPLAGPLDLSYYGEDTALHASRIPLDAVVATQLPLFVACAEFDPDRFQSEFVELLRQRLAKHGRLPRSYIASGHNHFSISLHLGGSDTRLSTELVEFVREICA